MNIKVKSVELAWKSDDGKILKHIVVTEDGQTFRTFSKTIAKEGWSGEVEVYEKNGENLVKQPQKAGFGTKEFKADPVKLKQDLALQIATNQSIQRQVALKCAVEVYVAQVGAGWEDYSRIQETFEDFMKLLNPKLGGENANSQSGTTEAHL